MDATTDGGRLKIAEMNGVKEKWEKKNAEYTDETIQDRCYDLLKLVAGENRRPFVCGSIEGWHRTGAVISLMTGRSIDASTGVLDEPLTWKEFTKCIHDVDVSTMNYDEKEFQEFLHNKLTGAKGYDKCRFIDQNSTVKMWYVNVPSDVEKNLTSILSKIVEHSHAISEQKRNSAKKSTEVMIAELILGISGKNSSSFGETMIDDNSCMYNPDFGDIEWAQKKKITATALEKMLSNAATDASKFTTTKIERDAISNDTLEMMSFKLPNVLFQEAFREYCIDPFNKTVSEKMRESLSFKTIEEEVDVVPPIKPPFLNTYQTMTLHPGKKGMKGMTTWMANTIFYLPRIIHILYAERNNKTLKTVGEDKTVQELCMYAVRHHGNAVGLINYSVDGIMQKHYMKLPGGSKHTLVWPLNIIPAAMFISDAINVMLIHPDEYPTRKKSQSDEKSNDDEIEKIRNSISETGRQIAMSLSAINAGGSSDHTSYGPNDIIHALGLFHDHFYPLLHLLQLQLTKCVSIHSIFRISDDLLLYN